MISRINSFVVMVCFCLAFSSVTVFSQSLTNKLEEEESFYVNYGKDQYTKLKIERDVVGLYDFFGEHIVDGVHLYDLSSEGRILSSEEIGDSIDYSQSNEIQKKDFYQKFSNMVVTQDAIGGLKTSFMIGDQITTRFTPLTFNKVNFNGIRWDLWSTAMKFSFLISRTRPGFLSKNASSGEALVEYPITPSSFPESYYSHGFRGNEDFSNKSPFGDYDLLWAFHAENTIASKVDVGVTYINHHVADVHKTSANPFVGNLPDSLMPEHVHFEFYDLTPDDTLDAGVYVENVTMFVNGREVRARTGAGTAFKRAFAGDKDGVLLPRQLPLARPQNGTIPIIVEFEINPSYWEFVSGGSPANSIKDVKNLKFNYSVAGNYLVFVSTDKQIPSNIEGEYNNSTRRVDYSYPTRSVGDMYDDGVQIDDNGRAGYDKMVSNYSTTYFGDYIAQSPRMISVLDKEFLAAVEANNYRLSKFNYATHQYEYNINNSSVTYGVNFKGDLFGINFNGEVALNQSENMLPGRNESRIVKNNLAGTIKAKREIIKGLDLSTEVYQIAPEWNTALTKFQASRYFNKTAYKLEKPSFDSSSSIPLDYQVHPQPLGDQYYSVDDNDDQDPFPESDRRHYPADLNAIDDEKYFLNDGSLSWRSDTLIDLRLKPSYMVTTYDDPDGVFASKSDRNKNGIPDYIEDFLLFSSDPPVFELGVDLNNNGIPDYEDDDILPDWGHSVGYVVTGNGIKTQGIRGVNLALKYMPIENTTVELGGIFEGIIDHDLDLETTGDADVLPDQGNGQSQVIYLTAQHQVIKRQQGLQYEIGNETRIIRDGIRNDAVRSITNRINEAIDVNYSYYVDPLNYRQAIVDNAVFGVNYVNIPGFEYGLRCKTGIEKHLALSEWVFNPNGYNTSWRKYEDRLSADFNFVNRLQYSIKFDKQYEGWQSVFNVLNRFELIPQYKLAFSLRKELSGPKENTADPRNITTDMRLDYNDDGEITILDDYQDYIDNAKRISEEWATYSSANNSYLLNVPILRANFKIAENTQLQLGSQWLRYLDMISSEDNNLKFTGLAQIVSSAQYKGYSVTFYLGGSWSNKYYDVHQRDPVTRLGSRYDISDYKFFAKIFSGV